MKNVGEHIAEWSVEKPESTSNVTKGLLRDWPHFKLVPNKATLLPDESMDVQVTAELYLLPLPSRHIFNENLFHQFTKCIRVILKLNGSFHHELNWYDFHWWCFIENKRFLSTCGTWPEVVFE